MQTFKNRWRDLLEYLQLGKIAFVRWGFKWCLYIHMYRDPGTYKIWHEQMLCVWKCQPLCCKSALGEDSDITRRFFSIWKCYHSPRESRRTAMGTVGTKRSDISLPIDTVSEFRSHTALYGTELRKWPITRRPKKGCPSLGFCYTSFCQRLPERG